MPQTSSRPRSLAWASPPFTPLASVSSRYADSPTRVLCDCHICTYPPRSSCLVTLPMPPQAVFNLRSPAGPWHARLLPPAFKVLAHAAAQEDDWFFSHVRLGLLDLPRSIPPSLAFGLFYHRLASVIASSLPLFGVPVYGINSLVIYLTYPLTPSPRSLCLFHGIPVVLFYIRSVTDP